MAERIRAYLTGHEPRSKAREDSLAISLVAQFRSSLLGMLDYSGFLI